MVIIAAAIFFTAALYLAGGWVHECVEVVNEHDSQ